MMHSSHQQTETQSSMTPVINPLQPPSIQQSLTSSHPPLPTVSNNQMLHSQMPTVRHQARSNTSSRSNSIQNIQINPVVPSVQSNLNPLAASSSQSIAESENRNNFVNVTSAPQVGNIESNNLSADVTLGQVIEWLLIK